MQQTEVDYHRPLVNDNPPDRPTRVCPLWKGILQKDTIHINLRQISYTKIIKINPYIKVHNGQVKIIEVTYLTKILKG